MEPFVVGVLVGILWSSQSDDHLENNVVKFGYIIDEDKKKYSLYIIELNIKVSQFTFFSFKTFESLFHGKSFAYLEIKLICSKVGRNVGSL
jgi:hypothetical protein